MKVPSKQEAAAASARAAGLTMEHGTRLFLAEMSASPITATILLPVVILVGEEALPAALPVMLLWVSTPFIAHDLSRPAGPAPRVLRARDRAALGRAARRPIPVPGPSSTSCARRPTSSPS